MSDKDKTTQQELDPWVEPNPAVAEGVWVWQRDADEGVAPWVVLKIVNGYARIQKDPWTAVRAVRTGNLKVIPQEER